MSIRTCSTPNCKERIVYRWTGDKCYRHYLLSLIDPRTLREKEDDKAHLEPRT